MEPQVGGLRGAMFLYWLLGVGGLLVSCNGSLCERVGISG